MRLRPAAALLLGLSVLLGAASPPWRWPAAIVDAPPPVPADNPMSAAKAELGRRLFYDADLSADGTLSCSSCHEQRHGFADSVAMRPGVREAPARRNAPGLANVAWRQRLTFSDPALTTLEAQAHVPLFGEHPIEMGMKGRETELARRLAADSCYARMFARAFPEKKGRIGTDTVVAALAAFQRTLISRGSPSALSPEARRGAAAFASAGCANCHKGADLTDDAYHRLEAPGTHDTGLAETSGRAEDAGRFRTPSLRNVNMTGPWWHDGSETTLSGAIRRHGGASIPEADMPALLAYLDSLTDPAFLTDARFSRPDKACGKRL